MIRSNVVCQQIFLFLNIEQILLVDWNNDKKNQ